MVNLTIDTRVISLSGMGRYLSNVLPRVARELHDFNIFLLGDAAELNRLDWTKAANITVIPCHSAIYSIKEQLEIPRRIPEETDLYWATHYNVPLLYSGKMLTTVYDVFHLAQPELVGGLHKQLYARLMFNRVVNKSKKIITISQFSADELLKFTGCKPDLVRSIHLGVDDALSDTSAKIDAQNPYLLYVGNVKPHKNLATLVDAFQKVAQDIPHDVMIVGKKEGFITGDSILHSVPSEIKDRVRFTGPIDDATLAAYYRAADMFVFPSFYEGFGLPPLEAMAMSCPVIASTAASIPEICGDAALYFDPRSSDELAEKIKVVLADPELRSTLINAGLANLERFSWNECANQTVSEIRALLNE
jgi:glycosyltransferase involved in cell wall biosynthesis